MEDSSDFDRLNLHALINNTCDLIWSVNIDLELISSNTAFDNLIENVTGKILLKGSNVLNYAISEEQRTRYKELYERAFSGEIFKITEYTDIPVVYWSELSFYPIRRGSDIIGTACYSHNITERKIAEEKNRRSEANLLAIFENASESFFLTDNTGMIITLNRNAEKVNALTCRTEMKPGRNIMDYITRSRQDIFKTILSKVSEGEAVQYDQSFEDLDGRYHCYDFAINPVIEAGLITAFCFSGRDITEQKLATEKIKQNERRLEIERGKFTELFLQAPSCICILTGPDHIFEMANPTYLELTGKINILGKSLREVFPEVESQGFLTMMADIYATGKPFIANEILIQIYRDKDGGLTDHYLNFVCQPFNNSNGEVEGIFFFANIVTEQVLTRQKIEENEKRYQALVENVGDAIVILSAAGKPQYASPSIERVLGYTVEEAMQLDVLSITHPADVKRVMETMTNVLANPGVSIRGHAGRMLHKDGTWHWYDAIATNMLHDPAVNGIIDTFRDITERKLAEEKIIHANRLYHFISQINQTIVHSKNEKEVFKKACGIAIEFGKFKMAWIGLVDSEFETVCLVASDNISADDLPKFADVTYNNHGPQAHAVQTGSAFICNDVANELGLPDWQKYAARHGIRSGMVLPIKKGGNVIGTFNLYAGEKDFFDEQEIRLLEEAVGDISFALDVFEKEKHRKQMADKVINSELRLNHAQSIAHVGSWDLNLSTGVATWSAEACRIYGFEPTDNLHTYEFWLSFIHPDDLEYVMEETNKGRQTLSSSAFYHRIIRRDGTIRHIYSQAQFEFDSNGIPVGINGVAHDITEMKEAQIAREQADANMRLIMDLIPQSIFVKDYNGKFIFVNKSFAALYGASPETLTDQLVANTIPVRKDAAFYLEQDRSIISSGKPQTIPEQIFTDHRGNTRLLHTLKVPFIVAGTHDKAVLGVTMDITEEKIAEAEKGKMMADIVQRNIDLEQFSYIVSHNLRAPVANILGFVDILQTIGVDAEEGKTIIAYLGIASSNLDNVIKDINLILDLRHKANEKKELVRFEDLLHEIKISLEGVIRNEQVKIIANFTANEEMVTLKSYLYSIFLNLVSNSIKYRHPDRMPVIEISSSKTQGKTQLVFKDNGIGIDTEYNNKYLFGLYKRFHTHVEGKGMGLYMVKTQVNALGGQIAISSNVNKGTEFTITFHNEAARI